MCVQYGQKPPVYPCTCISAASRRCDKHYFIDLDAELETGGVATDSNLLKPVREKESLESAAGAATDEIRPMSVADKMKMCRNSRVQERRSNSTFKDFEIEFLSFSTGFKSQMYDCTILF